MHPSIGFPILALLGLAHGQGLPKLPVGMNIHGNNYYSPPIFLDAMKSSGTWITYHAAGESPWETGYRDSIPADSNGYPLELPYSVGGRPQAVRCMLNDFHQGEHVVLHDGEGEIAIGGRSSARKDGRLHLELSGQGQPVWLEIKRSAKGNPVRNLRILPAASAAGSAVPTFHPGFLKGLEGMHSLRFMDWMGINASPQKTWSGRAKVGDYTQGGPKGIAIEHALELANLLRADPWFCVPHQADGEYLARFARLVKEGLHPSLKVYLEYSNEIWNWGFEQAHWVGKNAPGAEAAVSAGLRQVGQAYCGNPEDFCHPEKDAYMMDRTFKSWRQEFAGPDSARLVRVAGVQHAWYDNTGRILKYLFEKGAGCDAIAPAGYFSFEERHHKAWLAMPASQVTADKVLDSVFAVFDSTSAKWTRENAKYAKQYKVDFLVYEGGQHMQPWAQGEHPYNEAVWATQVHPRMYDLYMENFALHASPEVACDLFMAFSYVGARKSRWGSWGHLESYAALDAPALLRAAAPKYAALVDANTAKAGTGMRLGGRGRPADLSNRARVIRGKVEIGGGIRRLRTDGRAEPSSHHGKW